MNDMNDAMKSNEKTAGATDALKAMDALSFEQSLTELEKIVKEMEGGNLDLKTSLERFGRGVDLTRSCQKALQDAEQKVKILVGDGKDATLQTYDER